MKLKVCGLTNPGNIEQLSTMQIDYMGFIFYKKSPRYINENISFEFARSIPKHIQKTGVFVNEDTYSIFNAIAHYDLDLVQLHGEETEVVCKELKPFVKVIKAFGINENFDLRTLGKYVPHVDYFLFDTYTKNYGGSGKQFDHRILKNYNYDIPFFLSGGIDENSIEAIKQLNHPQLLAIDINSKFEITPGLKDISKINSFIQKLN